MRIVASRQWQEAYAAARRAGYRKCGVGPVVASRALTSAWAHGYADGVVGLANDPPYRNNSDHGGTWGYQLCWAYGAGYTRATMGGPRL